jgi:hypothetical protein
VKSRSTPHRKMQHRPRTAFIAVLRSLFALSGPSSLYACCLVLARWPGRRVRGHAPVSGLAPSWCHKGNRPGRAVLPQIPFNWTTRTRQPTTEADVWSVLKWVERRSTVSFGGERRERRTIYPCAQG